MIGGVAAVLSAPLFAYAATSAGYNLTQEGIEQNQYQGNTAGYTFQAEIGAPTESPTVSTNYQYDHGASWFSTGSGSPPTPVTPTPSPTEPPQSGALPQTTIQSLNQSSFQVIQINEHAVLVSWISNQPGFGRIIYGVKSVDGLSAGPTYGYPFTTPELKEASTYQAIVIDVLEADTLYYFRPVSRVNGNELIGPELKMTTRFKREAPIVIPEPTIGTQIPTNGSPSSTKPTKNENKPVPAKIPSQQKTSSSTSPIKASEPLITSVRQSPNGQYIVTGKAKPNSKVRIIVY